ncbi:MAG: ParA family protein [Candidatus Doudnabacteria bacterium]|nr:ParA family protein [Candidatus Doudnabacteria bacterium]MCA9387964.1 ParA family protein [Candidatus Andersenbacteria bacterium]
MAMITAIANQKGGTGKTTTALTLAAALCEQGKFVLVVDMDPQGNITSGLGVTHEEEQGVYAALSGVETKTLIRQTSVPCLDILSAGPELSGASIELVDQPQREFRLRQALSEIRANYDVILIDCPPTLGLLTLNALVAADNVLIPVQCEYYALEGLGQLLRTIDLVKTRLQPSLEILGAVMVMHDRRLKLSQDVVREVQQNFPYRVFETIVPRNVRLAESPSFGKSVYETAPWSKGAKSYKKLAEEFTALLP